MTGRGAVTDRAFRFAVVALVPSLVDVGLLVVLRQGLGWILVVADVVAIGVASVVSYLVHRVVTFRSDPYVRWVNVPVAFVAIAALAAAVDVAVLRALFAASGYDTVAGLVGAKLVALSVAAAFRLVAYRAVLMIRFTGDRRYRTERPPPDGTLRVSLVLPAFDEADRIGSAVAVYRAGLEDWAAVPRAEAAGDADRAHRAPEAPRGLEIIVVDDGSTDGTADAALAAHADQVVVLPANRGKGAAVRAGMLAARGRTVVFTDADLAYGPDQVAGMAAAVEDGWDVAIGDRRHPGPGPCAAGATRWRSWGSRVVNLLVYLVLLGSFRDTQCGLKACRADVARFVFTRARVDGFAFDIELLHLVERHGFSVVELPVRVAHSARTTVRPVRAAVRLLADIGRIRHWSATGVYETWSDGPPGETVEPGEPPREGSAAETEVRRTSRALGWR